MLLALLLLFSNVRCPPVGITIVVHQPETVPATELARAETIAGGILRRAGIRAVWRNAGPGDLTAAPDEIPLHMLPIHPRTLAAEANGYAILMGAHSYAGVSYPAVLRAARSLGSDQSVVLAAVMAHELGHILLGTSTHATNGVMVMRFGPHEIQAAARGELQFLRVEAQRMCAEIVRRTSTKS